MFNLIFFEKEDWREIGKRKNYFFRFTTYQITRKLSAESNQTVLSSLFNVEKWKNQCKRLKRLDEN